MTVIVRDTSQNSSHPGRLPSRPSTEVSLLHELGTSQVHHPATDVVPQRHPNLARDKSQHNLWFYQHSNQMIPNEH